MHLYICHSSMRWHLDIFSDNDCDTIAMDLTIENKWKKLNKSCGYNF